MSLVVRANRLLFNWIVRRVRNTPPVMPGRRPITVLSMVQSRDVFPYLLAIKSFSRFVQPSRVVVVADPTLNARDRATMRTHVPHVEFREAAEFHRNGIPKGGTWERLCAIAEYIGRDYVIQLDSDTVALGALDEVTQAATAGNAFTLGTGQGRRIVGSAEIAAWARGQLDGQDHVQLAAESCLDRIEGGADLKYVRGCSGFAGFPRRSFDAGRLRELCDQMARAMPNRWSEWGTEQFTSNVLIANMRGAQVLPYPKYCAPDARDESAVFLHFIGYVRYATPLYGRVAARVSRELQLAA